LARSIADRATGCVLRTRLRTAAVALPLLLGIVLWAPAGLFTAFIALVTILALYEISAMAKADGLVIAGLTLVGAVTAVPPLAGRFIYPWPVPSLVILAMLMLTARVGLSGSGSVKPRRWLALLGAAWVGALFPYFALLRNQAGGLALLILLLLLVVVSDSGAYFIGRAVGRRKLLPRVSPNKTVEGAVGGLVAVIAAAMILRPWLAPRWTAGAAALIATAIGAMAQAGDLANSAYKRVAGVKDSGWFFPGHGGLMDRACSLVFAVVLTYYCTNWNGA